MVNGMRRNVSEPGTSGRDLARLDRYPAIEPRVSVDSNGAASAGVGGAGGGGVLSMMQSAFGGGGGGGAFGHAKPNGVSRMSSAGDKLAAQHGADPRDRAVPSEYLQDLVRTPEALENVSGICLLAARGNLPALKAKAGALKGTALAAAKSLDGRTPLHFAAAANQIAVCEWLLEQGVPVNAVDAFGLTPLAEAVRWSHRELARSLHAKGACLLINGMLVRYHNFDAQVPLLNASMTDEDWEIDGEELKPDGMIGQGSFGLIYRAAWRGTPVAIKQIHIKHHTGAGAAPAEPGGAPAAPLPDDPSVEAIVSELREELWLMSRLHHPHVLQFLGAVTKPGPHSPAIVMELATLTLAQRYKNPPPLSFAEAMSAAIHVARGVAYLHGHKPNPIIHRDLKPSNVLLTHTGVWKVCDFGLSRLLPGKGPMSTAYRLTGETGSYVYMAPEVFKHESYSLKVDQYAYAMIVYQAFERERPFIPLRPMEAARAASMGRRPTKVGRMPPVVRQLVQSCWADDQQLRPSFEEIVDELSEFAAARGLSVGAQFTRYSGTSRALHCSPGGACAVS